MTMKDYVLEVLGTLAAIGGVRVAVHGRERLRMEMSFMVPWKTVGHNRPFRSGVAIVGPDRRSGRGAKTPIDLEDK